MCVCFDGIGFAVVVADACVVVDGIEPGGCAATGFSQIVGILVAEEVKDMGGLVLEDSERGVSLHDDVAVSHVCGGRVLGKCHDVCDPLTLVNRKLAKEGCEGFNGVLGILVSAHGPGRTAVVELNVVDFHVVGAEVSILSTV